MPLDHPPAAGFGNEKRLLWALGLTAGFMVIELIGGVLSGSLALIADAGHMLTDAGALALAWAGFRFARRPADPDRSYGYDRFEVLAAGVNGLALGVIAIWVLIEAATRFTAPHEVLALPMLAVAAIGLAVNLFVLWLLRRGDRDNLSMRGAMWHVMGDVLGSLAAIAAAVVILTTGWTPIDPILSVLVALLILRGAWRLVAEASHILLEGTPDDIDPETLATDLRNKVEDVVDIHHVHVWMLTASRPLLTAHARIADAADGDLAARTIKSVLRDHHGIDHSVIQIERGACPDG